MIYEIPRRRSKTANRMPMPTKQLINCLIDSDWHEEMDRKTSSSREGGKGEGVVGLLFEMCQTTKLLGIFSRLELHFCIMHETATTTMSEERTMPQ